MRLLVIFLLLTVLAIIPCFSNDSIEPFICFDGGYAYIHEPDVYAVDSNLVPEMKRYSYQLTVTPFHFDKNWSALAEVAMTGRGNYVLIGASATAHINKTTILNFAGKAGYEWTGKTLGLGLSFKLVKEWHNRDFFITEVDVKTNGTSPWYKAQMNFQVLPAIGVGIRAEKNMLIGPYVQLGPDNLWYLWLSYGYEESFKTAGVAAGLKIDFGKIYKSLSRKEE